MKNIDFGYGILCDDLDKQANEQGYALEDADLYETARDCINFLKYRKIATNKQTDMMFKKLHKKVIKSLKPLEESNEWRTNEFPRKLGRNNAFNR